MQFVLFPLTLALAGASFNAEALDYGYEYERFDSTINEIDYNDRMTNRYGTINGENFNSTEIDLGTMKTEFGSIGGQRFNCTSFTLGSQTTTNCQ